MADVDAVIDLHCHTSASFDSLAAPKAVVRAAAARGLTHLAITDHDRIDGALRARDAAPYGLTVIIGQEVGTLEGDLICVFLEYPITSGMSALETIAAAREQGALVGLPHPFDRHRASLLLDPAMEALAERVDWVETWNARIHGGPGNKRAATFARTRGLPGVAVSDAHSILEVGVAHATLRGDPSTPHGLREALATGTHRFGDTPKQGRVGAPIRRFAALRSGSTRTSGSTLVSGPARAVPEP